MGAYAELIDNNGAFAEFVHTYASMEVSDEERESSVLLFMSACNSLKCCLCELRIIMTVLGCNSIQSRLPVKCHCIMSLRHNQNNL